MATQSLPDPSEQHRAAQDGLALSLSLLIKRLWDSLFGDGAPTADLLPTFKAQAAALVQQGALAAQAIGQEFYAANRAAAGVVGTVRPALVAVPTPEQVAALVDKALTGLTDVASDSSILPSDLVANALTNVTGQLDLAVIDSGRDQAVQTVVTDRRALGFVRVPKPGACSFCMLMATRGGKGILYKSRETAGEISASVLWGKDAKGSANRYHAGCHCEVVAVYSRSYESPQHVKEAMELYDSEYVQSHRGKGRANAFRRVYERPAIERQERADRSNPTLTELNPAQVQHQLDVVRQLPDSEYKRNQISRLEQQLAA